MSEKFRKSRRKKSPSPVKHLKSLFKGGGSSAELQERNQKLAERLEALEDATWEVRESEEIHRSLTESFGDVVLHRTRQGTIQFSNNPYNDYFDDDHPVPPLNSVFSDDKSFKSTNGKPRDIELDTKQGKRWFCWIDMPIRDHKTQRPGIRSVARDITERKANEVALKDALAEAKDATAAKSRFLAMISHEIRTPLNGVIGMGKLLEDTTLAPDQRGYVEAIGTSGRALLGLVNDLLDSALIESGNMDLHTRSTDIRRLVEDAADILCPRAREKNVDLATFIGPNVPQHVTIDPNRFRQIVLNLAGNAVKFTESGGVAIHLGMKNGDLVLSVHDSGPGLTKSQCETIFDDFVQASDGATRAQEGAGLGLSISKQLARLMQGDISVRSTPKKGSVFTLRLPIEETVELTVRQSPAEPPNKSLALLCRDTPARAALALAAGEAGYKVSLCETMAQFKTLSAARAFNTIIADRNVASWQHELLDEIWQGGSVLCLLGNPGEQGKLSGQANTQNIRWLTWPVRQETLKRVLSEQEINRSTEATKQHSKAPFNETDLNTQRMEILVAEDNPINALLVKALLGKLGHNVTHVENGALACEAIQKRSAANPFDAILMDLHMPVLDGMQAIARIRKFEGKSRKNRIIVLSAHGEAEQQAKALKCGADSYLTKPLDFEAVKELLDSESAPARKSA